MGEIIKKAKDAQTEAETSQFMVCGLELPLKNHAECVAGKLSTLTNNLSDFDAILNHDLPEKMKELELKENSKSVKSNK